MAKRYYWLKLPEGFFRQKAIKKLRKIAGGDTYTVIYLKMLLVAIKQDGKLFFDGVEDNFYEELALDLDEEVDNVKITVQFLLAQGLMELIDETEYSLTECAKMTGSETASTIRSRRCRENKALQCNTDATQSNALQQNCNVEKEIEIEKEKEKKIDIDVCPEPIASGQQPTFITLPLSTGQGVFDVTYDYINSLRNLYPNVDVESEIRKMAGWLDSNPTRRKTGRGIKRFITNWLANEQDRGSRYQRYQNQPNRMSTAQYMEATAGWHDDTE